MKRICLALVILCNICATPSWGLQYQPLLYSTSTHRMVRWVYDDQKQSFNFELCRWVADPGKLPAQSQPNCYPLLSQFLSDSERERFSQIFQSEMQKIMEPLRMSLRANNIGLFIWGGMVPLYGWLTARTFTNPGFYASYVSTPQTAIFLSRTIPWLSGALTVAILLGVYGTWQRTKTEIRMPINYVEQFSHDLFPEQSKEMKRASDLALRLVARAFDQTADHFAGLTPVSLDVAGEQEPITNDML